MIVEWSTQYKLLNLHAPINAVLQLEIPCTTGSDNMFNAGVFGCEQKRTIKNERECKINQKPNMYFSLKAL
jgi:hypothetical protein